jgi:tRNA-Thr(GGU) m(6)t(6)A37 methyltransferase TsaA
VPRQHGIGELVGKIVFEKPFRDINMLRGIENFSHIWLLWIFSENIKSGYSATVRPPRLGGNMRRGVFATRAPFRPNSVGMSVVKIEKIILEGAESPIIIVSGVDMVNETPIIDIKPYIKSDIIDTATFPNIIHRLNVKIDESLLNKVPVDKQAALIEILKEDPRPSYHKDGRKYGFYFSDMEIFFIVNGDTLTVIDIIQI